MNLTLATQQQFNSVVCDFWTNEVDEIFMTREQIGQALGYSNPRIAIANIHKRHAARLDRFSGVIKLSTPKGGLQETTVYSEHGIYEVARRSEQPKADVFYDWVYELIIKLRKGETVLVTPQSEQDNLQIQMMRAKAMLNNSRTRQARLILEMKKDKTLSPIADELLGINALEVLIDKLIEHRPVTERTYTATELGEEFGVTANKIGRVANANGLKTEVYGVEVLDKSRYSSKQVTSFRYNETGRARLKELLEGKP